MIVTVSIREENSEEQRSVSASKPTRTDAPSLSAVRNAILDAGVAAIVAAQKQGLLVHVHKVAEAHLPMTGDGNA